MDLSALSVVLDEDNGVEVEKALEWVVCEFCDEEHLDIQYAKYCNYEGCYKHESYATCRECMEEVDGKLYHSNCIPFDWDLADAFQQVGIR